METICSKCNGKGYHHGFGEGGRGPDWCIECGGIGRWEEVCADCGEPNGASTGYHECPQHDPETAGTNSEGKR